ncbi:ABC transporter permease [Rhodococcus wratislaviensis]|uniref:ABC transporter permease n=1 Tax=Rhodococcus wratislaviensis TaxID=44752 RepID=UPI0036657994
MSTTMTKEPPDSSSLRINKHPAEKDSWFARYGQAVPRAGRWVATAALTLLLLSVIAFLMTDLMPGDPAAIIAGEYANPDQIEQVRQQLGLDQSMISRYLEFLNGVVTGDLGNSYQVQPGVAVMTLVLNAAPVTLSLLVLAMIIKVPVGVMGGHLAASHQNTKLDRWLTGGSSIALAVPPFVLASFLIAIFGFGLGWLPVGGYTNLTKNPTDWFLHLLLPALALSAVGAAEIARQTRGAIIDVREQDYVRMAENKGLGPKLVVYRHVLRNAATPVLTVIGLQVLSVLGGSIVIEQIFGMPGIGTLTYRAVIERDTPLLQGLVLVIAVIVIIVNLLIDLANTAISPKSRSDS